MNITAFYQHLDGLFAAGQIEQVEPYLLTQMVIANQEHDADASLAIINELTGFYRSQQRFEEAIRVAEQALDLCSKEYRLGSLSHATTLLNAATAYRFAGQSQKALELFRQCQAIYEEKLSPMDEHYAGLYNNMSGLLRPGPAGPGRRLPAARSRYYGRVARPRSRIRRHPRKPGSAVCQTAELAQRKSPHCLRLQLFEESAPGCR